MRTPTRHGLALTLAATALWPLVAAAQPAPDGTWPPSTDPYAPYGQTQPYGQPQYQPQYEQTQPYAPGQAPAVYGQSTAVVAQPGDPSPPSDGEIGPDGLYEEDYGATTYDEEIDTEAYLDYQDALSPYGNWENVDGYGYVWQPSVSVVGAGFSPYSTGGSWSYTEYGWTWVSDWDWGWAPFHYGRWLMIGAGWCWVPGRVWGPAWVHWRAGGGYVGWAPMGPRGVVVGPPPAHGGSSWRFVVAGTLAHAHPTYVAPSVVPTVWTATRSHDTWRPGSGSLHYNAGPAPHVVAATLGHAITPTPLHQLPQAMPRPTQAAHARMPSMSLAPAHAVSSTIRPLGTSSQAGPRPLALSTTGPRPLLTAPSSGQIRSLGPTPSTTRAPVTGLAPFHPAWAPRPSTSDYAPRYGASSAVPQAPHYAAPTYQPAPHYTAPTYQPAPHYTAPTYQPAPHYAAPTYQPAPHYAAPSYQPAPRYSAPSYSPPAYSAPHYTAPSYTPQAAAPAPAPHFSAPSFGGGGGGRRR